MLKNIGELIRVYREKKKISEADLSNVTGLSVSTIIKVENSQQMLSEEELKNVGKVLGFDLDEVNDILEDMKRINLLLDALSVQEEINAKA